MNRRRKRTRYSKPKRMIFSAENIFAIIFSAIALLVLGIGLLISDGASDLIVKIVSFLGTLSIFVSAINLIVSLKCITRIDTSVIGRIGALLLSGVCLLAWFGIYLVGLTS